MRMNQWELNYYRRITFITTLGYLSTKKQGSLTFGMKEMTYLTLVQTAMRNTMLQEALANPNPNPLNQLLLELLFLMHRGMS
jgi:hypothetical protein